MLDRVLGRSQLRERIEELEGALAACREERESLQQRLAAADDRRRTAVRDRQTAQEEVNRLEDRIAQLRGELDRNEGRTALNARGITDLGRKATADLVDLLSSVRGEPETLCTAMIADERPPAVDAHFSDRLGLIERAQPCLCCFDEHGVVEVTLQPPLAPDPFTTWDDRFVLESSWFVPDEPHTFALVRNDLFSIGRFNGEVLVDVEGFETDVMGRHSKGGFSQARFERRREEQIDEHLSRCRDRLADVDSAVPLVLTGSQEALDRLDVVARARSTVDASGSTAAIEDAFDEFWRTTVQRV